MHKLPTQIVTRRTLMRKIAIEDAAGWKRFNNQIAKRMQWDIVPSIVYARNEILHYNDMWEKGERYVYIVIEKATGDVIGDFQFKGIDTEKKRMEFGHALHPRTWGTGITYELLDAARRAAEGFTLWARVEEENIRSWKSLEKYKAKFIARRHCMINGNRKMMKYYELRP